jgi:transcriptional regulator with XRE-family HTH domain
MPNWGPLRGDDPEVHALVRALRAMVDNSGRSLRDLAQKMSYGKSTISDKLNGETRPDLTFVADLCKACHAPDQQGADRHYQRLEELWRAADPSRASREHRESRDPEREPAPSLNGDDTIVRVLYEMLAQVQRRTMEEPQAAVPAVGQAATAGAPGAGAAGVGSPTSDPDAPVRILGPAPRRNDHFAGRSELLTELRARFENPSTQVLYGMVGVGKSQLAAEYAYRHHADYRMIWWVPAGDIGWLRSTLAGLAPHVGLEEASGQAIEDAFRSVLTRLDIDPHLGRKLLIFDNAGPPEAINRLIPRTHADVLITTRDPAWRTAVTDALLVDTFTREESVDFLRGTAVPKFSEADARRLATAVGDLPLALEHVVALRDRTGFGVDAFVRELSAHPNRTLDVSPSVSDRLSLVATCSLLAIQLQESCPDALSLLQACAAIDGGTLSLANLAPVAADADADVAALLSDWHRLMEAVQRLGSSGLAQIDPAGQTIRVHPLIAALIKDEHSV